MMSSGPSLTFSNNENYQPAMKFLMNISVGSYITISNFAIKTGIDYSEGIKVLEELSQEGILEKRLAVRCPDCGLLLDIVQPEDYVIGSYYCANCDTDFDITNDCVDVVFKVVKSPFVGGQKNKSILPKRPSALNTYSLETFLKNGGSFNNENKTPGITYFNKLHSSLINNSLQFGIIISKFRAAKTLQKFSHDIFLKDKMIIINLDRNDLEKIVKGRANLLELLERKIGEVKLDTRNDLVELGLFEE